MRSRLLALPRRALGWASRHRSVLGKTLLMAALLAVAVLPALVDNTVIGYLPVLLWAIVVVGMLVYFALLKRGIAFQERADVATCQRGESADVNVDVENASLLLAPRIEARLYVSNLTGGIDAITTEEFSLLPKETRELCLSARFDHIGTYRVGLYSMKLRDLFGLYAREYRAEDLHEVEVTPRIAELQGLDIAEEQTSDANQYRRSVVSDGYDYVGMREYELGDPMKSIHWKASARYGDFMTRLYERQINPSVCVIVDRSTRWLDDQRLMAMYDAVIESALSVAAYARRNGIDCTIAVPDEAGEVVAFNSVGQWGYKDIMRVLPRLEEDDGLGSAGHAVDLMSQGMYASSNIIVCSACPTEALLSELIQARLRQKNARLLFACPPDLEREEDDALLRMLARLSAGHVPYLRFARVDELGEREW